MQKILVCVRSVAPALAHAAVARDWVATTNIFGDMLNERLTLEADGDKLTGTLGDDTTWASTSGPHPVSVGLPASSIPSDVAVAVRLHSPRRWSRS